MKLLAISICFFCLSTISVHAQRTLEFNQVLYFDGSETGNQVILGTVPTDKVWKVTYFQQGNDITSTAGIMQNSFLVLGQNGYSSISTTSNAINYGRNEVLATVRIGSALWLPANQDLVLSRANTSGTAFYTVSVIEFNIVE